MYICRINLKNNIMGVRTCNRKGCDNIMCQTYIPEVGYICSNCRSEFEDSNSEPLTENNFMLNLKKFMETEASVKYDDEQETSVYDFFDKYTR